MRRVVSKRVRCFRNKLHSYYLKEIFPEHLFHNRTLYIYQNDSVYAVRAQRGAHYRAYKQYGDAAEKKATLRVLWCSASCSVGADRTRIRTPSQEQRGIEVVDRMQLVNV